VDHRVRDYLVRAHNKVITHCDVLLRADSLARHERERLQRCWATTETELEGLRRGTVQDSPPLATAA